MARLKLRPDSPVSLVLRLALAFLAFLLACPIRFHFPTPGLDPSYAVALNYFAEKGGYVFGRDVAFTYGPLAWVSIPMGANLATGVAVQLTLWLSLGAVLAWTAIRRVHSLVNWTLLALCLYAGAGAFWQFGYAGPDLFTGFFALLLLAMAATSDRHWWAWLAAAGLLAAGLFLVKLSSGVLAGSAIAAWPVFEFFRDRQRATRAAAAAWLGLPLLFAAVFLIYHPSPAVLLQYIRASLDVSSGYSVAMSLPDEPQDFRAALWMLAGYGLFAIALVLQRQRMAAVALAFLGPLFLTFKHAFVRPPGHIEILFGFVPLMVGILVLFTKFELPSRAADWVTRLRTAAPLAAFIALAAAWLNREAFVFSPNYILSGQATTLRWREAARGLNFTNLKAELDRSGREAMKEDLLPGVPHKPTAVFPWELSYAVANGLELRPLPVLQAYSAYTAMLDEWNASWLNDPAKAAPQILFEWAGIDGRHPFLDVPATYLAMLRHYDVTQNLGVKPPLGDRLVLTRRATPRFGELHRTGTAKMRLGELLQFEPGRVPLVAKIRLKLTLAGAARKFFYKLPELRMVLVSRNGRAMVSRVIADTLADGVAVNFTPHDLASFERLMRQNVLSDPFAMLQFSGEALPLYEPEAEVEWFELPDYALKFDNPPAATLEGLIDMGISSAAHLEAIDSNGVMGFGANETVPVNCNAGFVVAQGWAVDPGGMALASAVYLKVGDQLFPAEYGSPRDDVLAQFRSAAMRNSGFVVALPSAVLAGGTPKRITAVVRGADRKSFTTARESVLVRCR